MSGEGDMLPAVNRALKRIISAECAAASDAAEMEGVRSLGEPGSPNNGEMRGMLRCSGAVGSDDGQGIRFGGSERGLGAMISKGQMGGAA